ncbi:DUF3426 domain-containing protein [Leeia sp.]|uniref:DUF3426 domain-containing protein n=1 Tax=Leeia sp. TaxID=2884678 RepID=UPI0035B0E94C
MAEPRPEDKLPTAEAEAEVVTEAVVTTPPVDLLNLLDPQRPRDRWRPLWALLSLLALAGLIAQAGWLYREPLYKALPFTRSIWPPLCAQLGCKPPLLQDADVLRIDNVVLEAQPGQPDLVHWSLELSNKADYPVAMPLLELSLTNTQNEVVARRILTPQQYAPQLPGHATLSAGSAMAIQQWLKLDGVTATGYKVDVAYRQP